MPPYFLQNYDKEIQAILIVFKQMRFCLSNMLSIKYSFRNLRLYIYINGIWSCPVSRIHRLHLCRGVRSPPNECPVYDTKQSDGKVPVILEFWGMQSTLLLSSLPGPLWPRVVAPDKVPMYGLDRTYLRTYAKLNYLK